MDVKIIIFLFISVSLYGDISIISGVVNDNYTGSIDNGVSGRYIGADDFLTFSMFTIIKKDYLKIYLHDQIVTSRKLNYRYDLFHFGANYFFEKNGLSIAPHIGIIYKGNMGGENFQNNFHSLRDLPPLYLEYTNSELRPVTGLDLNISKKNILLYKDKITCTINIDIPFGIKPISEIFYGTYVINSNFINFEFLAGHKFYFNNIDQYSDFVRSGGVFGVMAVIKLWKDISINQGFLFFPSENLENDPVYMDIDHSYSPQFWIGVGFKSDVFSILDMIKF